MMASEMYNKSCPFCNDKVYCGYTQKHVDYKVNQHILSKHPEKIQILE